MKRCDDVMIIFDDYYDDNNWLNEEVYIDGSIWWFVFDETNLRVIDWLWEGVVVVWSVAEQSDVVSELSTDKIKTVLATDGVEVEVEASTDQKQDGVNTDGKRKQPSEEDLRFILLSYMEIYNLLYNCLILYYWKEVHFPQDR